MRLRRDLALLLLLALGTAACSSSTSPSTTTPAPSTTTAVADTESFTLDDHVAWLVGVLDAGEMDAAEATERFTPGFLEQIPFADLNVVIGQVAPAGSGPWGIEDQSLVGSAGEISLVSSAGTRWTMNVAMAPSAQIDGLVFNIPSGAPDGYTTEQLDADVAGFAAQGAVGIYEVTNGMCEPIHELNGEQPLAIGSAFKLWVLAELANQIGGGTASWDEPLEVRADLRSTPDGEVYQLADGDTLTLRQFAGPMISISDNTATDHLLDRLGRESVEAAMVRAGVADPTLNRPLLSTREMTWLKFLPEEPNPAEWNAADVEGRRQILSELAASVMPWVEDPTIVPEVNADGVPFDEPRNLDIEWFASPQDLCRTHVHLAELASTPGLEPVAEILSINPGVPFDPVIWPEIRFKGGSEPGVVAVAWWLRRDDGREFVVAGGFNDPEVAFDATAGIQIIANAVDLI